MNAQTPFLLNQLQESDQTGVVVIGLMKGNSDYQNMQVRMFGGKHTISPTVESKYFSVVKFNRENVRIEFKIDVPGNKWAATQFSFRFFSTERSLWGALLQRQVDMAMLSDEDFARAVNRSNPAYNVRPLEKAPNTLEMIAYNLTHPILQEIAVRKAIAYAVSRKKIKEDILNQKGEPAQGSVFEPDNDYYPRGIEKYNANRRRAIEILRSSGWIDMDNDGIREKDGRKLQISLAYRKGIEVEQRIAKEIDIACSRIGIDITPVPLLMTELSSRLKEKKYDAVLWEHQFEENARSVYDFFTDNESSFIHFSNGNYERIFALHEQESSAGRKRELTKQMLMLINENSVVTCLVFKWYDLYMINSAKLGNVINIMTTKIRPIDEWQLIPQR